MGIKKFKDLIPMTNQIQFFQIEASQFNTTIIQFSIAGKSFTKDLALLYLQTRSNQQKTNITFTKNGCAVSLGLGQFVTTHKQLGEAFNWGIGKVRYNISKWVKSSLISKLELRNKQHRSVGILITCNEFIDQRKRIENQRLETHQNYKKTYKNLNTLKPDFNQLKTNTSTPKSIKENTYKNNIRNKNQNSLIFETNKKLYDFNAKILEEKKQQEQKLFDLEISLKKEKTKNNQLKSMKRFEIKGEIKTDKIKINWDFQKTEDYKQVAEKLKMLGFEQFAINKFWWKNSTNIQRLIDFIDYTQLKYDQGKVKDKKKFLYHALQANYDLGELEKARWESKSQNEKYRIETERLRAEEDNRVQKELLNTIKNEQSRKEYCEVTNWIKNNQSHTIFNQFLIELELENKFFFGILCKKARSNEFTRVIDYLKSDKTSKMDLCGSGFYFKIRTYALTI